MNHVTLTGRLTKEPETHFTRNGTPVTTVRLAVDGANDQTTYLNVTGYGKLAESVAKYCDKGRLVGVAGKLVTDEWTTPEGEKRSRMYVAASSVEFFDRPKNNGAGPAGAPTVAHHVEPDCAGREQAGVGL